MSGAYAPEKLTRGEVDTLPGATVLEFGANGCGICQAARPAIDAAFEGHPAVRRLRVADGKGLPLGRSFGVKLWPTLVFLRDGSEVARLVRPTETRAIEDVLARLAGKSAAGG